MIEEKGVEGMGETEEEIAMIEPNVEIEARGSMMGKEEEGELMEISMKLSSCLGFAFRDSQKSNLKHLGR